MYKQLVTVLSSQDGSNNQDITFAENWTPKAAIFLFNRANTSLDTFQEGYYYGIGFTDGTNQRCMFADSVDNITNSDCYAGQWTDAVMAGAEGTAASTVAFKASFSQWITGTNSGIRINWSDPPSAQFYITVVFLGGNDIEAKVDHMTSDFSTTGDKSYTGSSWQPELLFALCSPAAYTTTGIYSGGGFTIGAATSSSAQWSQMVFSSNSANTSITKQSFSNQRISYLHGTTLVGYVTFSTFNSNGFTVNVGDAFTFEGTFYFLALRGVHFSVGNATEPTSIQTQTVTNNKNNEVVMIFGIDDNTADTVNSNAMQTIGVSVKDVGQKCLTFEDQAGNALMVVVSRHDSNQVYLNMTANATATSSTLDDEAATGSLNNGNFTLSWTNIGQARHFRYLTIGSVPVQQLNRAVDETYNVTANITRSQVLSRGLPHTYDVTASITAQVQKSRQINENYNVSETLDKLLDLQRTIEETYNVTETLQRSQQLSRLISENYNVTEQISKILTILRSIDENYNVTEVINRLQLLEREIEEIYNVSESLDRSQILEREIQETYNVSEVIDAEVEQGAQHLYRDIDETYNVAETLDRIKLVNRNITENYNVAEIIERSQILYRVIGETYNVAESLTRALINSRQITENYNVEESLNRIKLIYRTISENYNVAETIIRTQILLREIQQSYNVTELIEHQIEGQPEHYYRTIEETYNVAESLNRTQILNRNITENYNVNESITRSQILNRELLETYNVAETIIRTLINNRTILETYNVAESLNKLQVLGRLIQETYNITESIQRIYYSFRQINETYNVTETIEREIIPAGQHLFREIQETYDITEVVNKLQVLGRQILESYDVSAILTHEGGQPEPVVTEELKFSMGGQLYDFSRLKKKILLKNIDILDPFDTGRVYINNQRAFLIDPESIQLNIISSQIKVKAQLYNNKIKSSIRSRKEYNDDLRIGKIYQELQYDQKQLDQLVKTLPSKIYILNHKIGKFLVTNTNMVKCPITINKSKHENMIKSELGIKDSKNSTIKSKIYCINNNDNSTIKSKMYIETIEKDDNNTIKFNLFVESLKKNSVKSGILESRKAISKKIMDILKYKNQDNTTNIIKSINEMLGKNDTKEYLLYYVQTYQEKFNVERTKTNRELNALEKLYQKRLERYYSRIVDEYKDNLANFEESKLKYGDEVRQLIRTISQKGYELGIDYVSKSLSRPDIYITQQNLDTIKNETEKNYIYFFDSIFRHIKALQYKQQKEELEKTDSILPFVEDSKTYKEFPIPDSVGLLLKSMGTTLVALATIDKIKEMEDQLKQKNIPISYIFVSMYDERVCEHCIVLDYRLSNIEFSIDNVFMLPRPPIHLHCRCRILHKIGNKVIRG